MHEEELAEPVEKLPASQGPDPWLVVEPARQYLPAGQGKHADVFPVPAVENVPALHRPPGLPSAVVEPARQYLPALQGEHAGVIPKPKSEYEPGLH